MSEMSDDVGSPSPTTPPIIQRSFDSVALSLLRTGLTGAPNVGVDATDVVDTKGTGKDDEEQLRLSIARRGRWYPPRHYQNFDFDPSPRHLPSNDRSHWERLPTLSQNVVPYLCAHGLSEETAAYQSRRRYVQRWTLVDVVGPGESSAGAVFEVNTDDGRRVSTYTLDGAGWDEDCPDDAVLFGSHVDDIFAGTGTAGDTSSSANDSESSSNNERARKLNRHARWEGRSHVSISASSSRGVTVPLERTERFLFRITDHCTPNSDHNSSSNSGASDGLRLPPNTDGTVMVVERTYYPPGAGDVAFERCGSAGMGERRGSTCALTDLHAAEQGSAGGEDTSNGNEYATAVRCREVFVRCYHNGPGSSSARAGRVLSCNFEEVAPPPPFAAGPSDGGDLRRDDGRQPVVRVRSVLVPLGGSDRYRVVLEGDVEDNGGAAPSSQGGCFGLDGLTVRGLLGLLSDGMGDGGRSISSSIDSSASCARKGGATVVTAEDVLSLNPDDVAGMLLGLAGGRGAGDGGAVTLPSSASALASAMAEEEERAEKKYAKFLASATEVVQRQIEGLLSGGR